MGLKSVTTRGVNKAKERGSFGTPENPMFKKFKLAKLKESETPYVIRLLPPFNDDEKFADEFNGFALPVARHYGVGKAGREFVNCPNEVAPKLKIGCRLCDEFRAGSDAQKVKLSFPYYALGVFMRPVEGYPQFKENGKFQVYLFSLTKKQMYDEICEYYDDPDRAVIDPCDLQTGCPILVKVSQKKTSAGEFKQYQTKVADQKVADISEKIDIADIIDLRELIYEIPSKRAYSAILEGMPISAAIELYGTTNTVTGVTTAGEASDAADEGADDDFSTDTDVSGSIDELLEDDEVPF